MSCKEFNLDDLLAITAIPVTDYSLGTRDWQLKPTILNAARRTKQVCHKNKAERTR